MIGYQATSVATGFVMGDGTITQIDNSVAPARLFGARQFLGSRDVEDTSSVNNNSRESASASEGVEASQVQVRSDDNMPGFCFLEGHPGTRVEVELKSFGFTPVNFPFFVYAALGRNTLWFLALFPVCAAVSVTRLVCFSIQVRAFFGDVVQSAKDMRHRGGLQAPLLPQHTAPN